MISPHRKTGLLGNTNDLSSPHKSMISHHYQKNNRSARMRNGLIAMKQSLVDQEKALADKLQR